MLPHLCLAGAFVEHYGFSEGAVKVDFGLRVRYGFRVFLGDARSKDDMCFWSIQPAHFQTHIVM